MNFTKWPRLNSAPNFFNTSPCPILTYAPGFRFGPLLWPSDFSQRDIRKVLITFRLSALRFLVTPEEPRLVVVTKWYSDCCNAVTPLVHELHTTLFQCSYPLFRLGITKLMLFCRFSSIYGVKNALLITVKAWRQSAFRLLCV